MQLYNRITVPAAMSPSMALAESIDLTAKGIIAMEAKLSQSIAIGSLSDAGIRAKIEFIENFKRAQAYQLYNQGSTPPHIVDEVSQIVNDMMTGGQVKSGFIKLLENEHALHVHDPNRLPKLYTIFLKPTLI